MNKRFYVLLSLLFLVNPFLYSMNGHPVDNRPTVDNRPMSVILNDYANDWPSGMTDRETIERAYKRSIAKDLLRGEEEKRQKALERKVLQAKNIQKEKNYYFLVDVCFGISFIVFLASSIF